MSVKYVNDFEFPSEFGFSKSASKGFAKGGAVHSDARQDKKMVKVAVHKHEKAQHPGEPLTKLKEGSQKVFATDKPKVKVKADSKLKQYTKTQKSKNTRSVEKGVEQQRKRERVMTQDEGTFLPGEWIPPMDETSREMLMQSAKDIEEENIRLEKSMIEGGGELPEYLKKKYGFKRGGQIKQDGSGQGQQVRAQKGKGSYNREPLVGMMCGGTYKK